MIGVKFAGLALAAMLGTHHAPAWQYSIFPAKFGSAPGTVHTLYVSNTGPRDMRISIRLGEIRRVQGKCVSVPGPPSWARVISPETPNSLTIRPGTRRVVRVGIDPASATGPTGAHDLAVTAAYVMGKSRGATASAGLTAQGLVRFPGITRGRPCVALSVPDKGSSPLQTLLAIVATGIGVAILIVAYWLPTILAKRRRVRGLGQVAIVNGLLGWTVIGWIVALVMAYRDRTPGQHRAAPGRPEGFIA